MELYTPDKVESKTRPILKQFSLPSNLLVEAYPVHIDATQLHTKALRVHCHAPI
jgi:hypothetical protein